jgi:hypothetical protein
VQPTSPRARLRAFRLLVLLLAAALGAAVLALVPRKADAQAPGLPPVGTGFAATGPYQVTVQTDSAHTYYSPATLGQNGVKHPIILWGNGTGTTPPIYATSPPTGSWWPRPTRPTPAAATRCSPASTT